MQTNKTLVGLVGPCAAGKSLLKEKLEARGYRVSHIAQEHSFVPDMWKRHVNPDILIFLDVSYPRAQQRRKTTMSLAEYLEQHTRLKHARQHADLYVNTDDLAPEEVLERVLGFLERGASG